jgi:hypothetical protein
LAQWAVGDLSGGQDVKDIQSHAPFIDRGFLAIHFVKVKYLRKCLEAVEARYVSTYCSHREFQQAP